MGGTRVMDGSSRFINEEMVADGLVVLGLGQGRIEGEGKRLMLLGPRKALTSFQNLPRRK